MKEKPKVRNGKLSSFVLHPQVFLFVSFYFTKTVKMLGSQETEMASVASTSGTLAPPAKTFVHSCSPALLASWSLAPSHSL